jgi:hypothetical protein
LRVAEPVTIALHHALAGVDAADRRPEQDFDVVVGVELLVLHERLLVRLAAQELLRERRAVVRKGHILRDQRDPAFSAFLAIRLDRPGGGEASADDHELEVLHAR